MTGKQIFKMEMFKFMKEKSYMITAGILAVLNIMVTLFIMYIVNGFTTNTNSIPSAFASMMVFVTIFVIFANWLFLFLYPFHIISVDYKNNVMAMLVASGVNRTKLFFSKIGAVIICTVLLSIAITIIPVLIIFIDITTKVGAQQFIEGVSSIFSGLQSIDGFSLIVMMIFSYLASLMTITASAILVKGSNKTVSLFIGFSILISLVSGVLNQVINTNAMDTSSRLFVQSLYSVLTILIFGFIGVKTLQKQIL